jgi:hypothetical protein
VRAKIFRGGAEVEVRCAPQLEAIGQLLVNLLDI